MKKSNPDDKEKHDEEKIECSRDVPKEQWGRIVFVLENKFKSLPREDQLIEYTQKVVNINGPIDKKSELKKLNEEKRRIGKVAKETKANTKPKAKTKWT